MSHESEMSKGIKEKESNGGERERRRVDKSGLGLASEERQEKIYLSPLEASLFLFLARSLALSETLFFSCTKNWAFSLAASVQ